MSPENAKLLLHLMLLDGHELKLVNNGKSAQFVIIDKEDQI